MAYVTTIAAVGIVGSIFILRSCLKHVPWSAEVKTRIQASHSTVVNYVSDLRKLAFLQPFVVDLKLEPLPSDVPERKRFLQTITEMVPTWFGRKAEVKMTFEVTLCPADPTFFEAVAKPSGFQAYLFSMRGTFSLRKISDSEVEFVDRVEGSVSRVLRSFVASSASDAHIKLCATLKKVMEDQQKEIEGAEAQLPS